MTACSAPHPVPSAPSAASYYDSAAHAWLYDRRWEARSRTCLPSLEKLVLGRLGPGAALLDLCCGTGGITKALAERGFVVTGCDLALAMLARARTNAPGCRLVLADARKLPFRRHFDAVLANGEGLNQMLKKRGGQPMAFDPEAGLVSYRSLSQAGRALKVFMKIHLHYHNCTREIFAHFGLWTTVEALIYRADTLNEGSAPAGAPGDLDTLRELLAARGLLDGHIAAELDHARAYFALERRVGSGEASLAEVQSAAALRSFDFRLLHRLLFRVKGWSYDEATFRHFAKFEECMEYDDDLESVRKDAAAGSFNVIAALSRHGSRELKRYCDSLVAAVTESLTALGPRFLTTLHVYYALSPESVLAPLLE